MTNTSKYSSDVESMTISENVPTWQRERTSEELHSFVESRLSIVGELDPTEYELVLG